MTIPLAIAAAEPHPLIMLPFAAMLLCIALLPFILKHRWEQNYHLVATSLAAITIGYYVFALHNPGRLPVFPSGRPQLTRPTGAISRSGLCGASGCHFQTTSMTKKPIT